MCRQIGDLCRGLDLHSCNCSHKSGYPQNTAVLIQLHRAFSPSTRPGIRNALPLTGRKTMTNQTDTADLPIQDNSDAATTGKEEKLDRIANEAASRAGKRQQRYDQEHNIFTV